MDNPRRAYGWVALLVANLLVAGEPGPAHAYIANPLNQVGELCSMSTYITVIRVEKVSKEKGIIIFRKVRDIKGTYPREVVRHVIDFKEIPKQKFNMARPEAKEFQYAIQWAEVGKTAIMFSLNYSNNGHFGHTYIDRCWYSHACPARDWDVWRTLYSNPAYLRTWHCGSPAQLLSAVEEMLAGKESLVPILAEGSTEDLRAGLAKIQGLRVSLRLGGIDPKRDVVRWREKYRSNPLVGLPGFTHSLALGAPDYELHAVSVADVNASGKLDLCLVGTGRVAVTLNSGDRSFSEMMLPASGARAAVWADYNGDGKPDLLLATATGPRLFTNLGGGIFRDDSRLLPPEAAYDLTAAAWIDYDGDGRPDILLGNGEFGLRLYRNAGPTDNKEPLKLGKWHYIGPFDNPNMKGFDVVYPPEKEIDLAKKYSGKDGVECAWQAGEFTDGQINNLALFKPEHNKNAVVYLYRELDCAAPTELPVSLGSDDTITLWLNGQKLLSANVYRAAAPDQHLLTLKLNKGKNQLLLKICQGDQGWAFYLQAREPSVAHWQFTDVSSQLGLGPNGIGSKVKGDTLTVCDVNGDGRPDFLYGAGTGMLLLNTGKGFVEAKDCGIKYKTGKVGPVFVDFTNSGAPSLCVPQLAGGCKLFKNDGTGHFTDVSARTGDLARFTGIATCAAWGDVDNDGHLDLVIGCLGGPNRYFRNRGDGTFEDATEALGLDKRSFNTQGISLVDLNHDGVLDLVCINQGQDSLVLFGNPQLATGKKTPLTIQVAGRNGLVGSRVRLFDQDGKLLGMHDVSGSDGRGGQQGPFARFAAPAGKYRVEVRSSSGAIRAKEVTLGTAPSQATIDID
jgi:hypothetical protein